MDVSKLTCIVAGITKLGVKVSGRCSLGGVGGALDWILANRLGLIFSFRKWEFSRSHSHKSSHDAQRNLIRRNRPVIPELRRLRLWDCY